MRKMIFTALVLSTFAALVWAGGDPWKSKPYQQWTDGDIAAILQTSPWAKVNVTATGAWRPLGSAPMTGPTPGAIPGSSADNSKLSDGAMANQLGGADRERKASIEAASQAYVVYWWSSRTIRAAFARQAVLHRGVKPEDAEKMVSHPFDEFEILVQAANMELFEKRGEQAFADAAYIEMKKSKEKVAPSHVTFTRGPDGHSVTGIIFYFPKTLKGGAPTIGPDEKVVDFHLRVADSTLVTYFEPKKMADMKGDDL